MCLEVFAMSRVADRFLRYVSYDTGSKDDVDTIPSTQKQFALAYELEREMKAMGLEDVSVSDNCYVYGYIPANAEGLPSLGFIAHMDTVSGFPCADILPRIVENYEGGDIYLNPDMSIDEATYPYIRDYVGQDLIVTDGRTVLGADDKAGIAEILTMAELLMAQPELKHGRICIGFTPDEEVGHGADGFDVKGFGADFAYTVDGGAIGEIEYENFNACTAKIAVRGNSIHPGTAKGRLVNANHVAMEFDAMLPAAERPEYTDGYEGFYHLEGVAGDAVNQKMLYIIRDHDREKFEAKKALMRRAAEFINVRYGDGTLKLHLTDTYYNMRDMILPHMHLIDTARAAMDACGVAPNVLPIRGGTDGARLSYMGLPCPNLCTGGCNCHGPREFVSIQSMETICRILLKVVELTYKRA